MVGPAWANFRAFPDAIWYDFQMNEPSKITRARRLSARKRLDEAAHLQAIEGNPLDAEDRAMFAMFEREGWDHEQRRAYILDQAIKARGLDAAE